jgi:hypothetical protein
MLASPLDLKSAMVGCSGECWRVMSTSVLSYFADHLRPFNIYQLLDNVWTYVVIAPRMADTPHARD